MAWSDELAHQRRELEEATATVWSDGSILTWYNDGADDFALQTKQLYGATTITATTVQAVALPAYTAEVETVRIGATVLLREDVQSWELLSGNPLTATGNPHSYALVGDYIYLRPIPTASTTVTLFRYYRPTPIVNATAGVHFGGKYARTLRNYVKARASEQIADIDSARHYEELYRLGVTDAMRQTSFMRQRGQQTYSPREVF